MTGLVDLLVHHAAAELVRGLLHGGILDDLVTPRSAAELAAAHRLDPAATACTLAFLARTTPIVVRRGPRFALAPAYAHPGPWRGLIEKFVEAYRPIARDPVARLRAPGRPGAIDRRALTRSYARDDESVHVVDTILGLAPTGVLDLGCGRGKLLARVCGAGAIRGWGVDLSPTMCRAARRHIAAAGLARTVAIRRGSIDDLGQLLSPVERRRISVVHAASLLNERMRDPAVAVATLARLRRWFPRRWLVVVDYLGAPPGERRRRPYTELTDLMQVLSGQGAPPPSHRAWAVLYHAAGARLVRAAEARTYDLRWFIHLVRLGR